MLTRIITAVVGLIVFLPIMYFSGTYVFDVAIAAVSVIAMYELLSCVGMKKSIAVGIPVYVYAVALPLYIEVSYKYIYNLSVLVILWLMFTSVMSHGKYGMEKLASLASFSVYVVSSFTGLILLRRLSGGQFIIWLVFIGAWVTDTAAYFVGRFFGKHKLIPDVSPKKTVEGAVGGVVFCTAAFVLYGFVIQKYFDGISANLPALAAAGVIASVVSQLGDLVMSKLKRTYDIKDFGKILPGHGGILDRFDSIIAVSAFLMIITSRPDIFHLFRVL